MMDCYIEEGLVPSRSTRFPTEGIQDDKGEGRVRILYPERDQGIHQKNLYTSIYDTGGRGD